MKNNIHIIPTDKPSKLHLAYDKDYYLSVKPFIQLDTKNYKSFNIYITFDDKIKEGDWVLDDEQDIFKVLEINHTQGILRSDGFTYVIDICKKIILTTDQDLIKDGVQAIDDEFLERFVKNPSCEEVEFTRPNKCKVVGCDLECILFKTCENIYIGYKIIIPKEEPKQETLEEILERLSIIDTKKLSIFLDGMMYQQERSYSEEDIKIAFTEGHNSARLRGSYKFNGTFEEDWILWFEQFKKK